VEVVNPVLPGMHPDPTVCRIGRDFYLACSSFEYFPGVPLYTSRDLVHWTPLGHALTRRSQLDLRGAPSSGGIYAPTLRHHEGTFFLVTTLVGRGNFVVTARSPRGPWSDPLWLDEDGVDPSLAFLDGRVFYTRNGRGTDPDHPFVYQGELTLAGGPPIAVEPRVIWRGTGGIWPEAPHLYRRGGWYYLVAAEGGTSYGHSVVIARATDPYGPFEPSPHGPLLTHRDRPRLTIQATGHADLVDLEDGTTWAVLLAIRPRGGRHHHLGRETFLAPVSWGDDGWPRMSHVRARLEGPALAQAQVPDAPERLRFRPGRLPTGWLSVRSRVRGSCTLRERPGFLRLWGTAATIRDVGSPALVCRRQQHFEATARARLQFDPVNPGEHAGLCLRANEDFNAVLVVALGPDGRELRLDVTLRGETSTLARHGLGVGPVTLELRATAGEYRFSGGTGGLDELGRVATRSFSAETILASSGRHHFTGAMIGLYATGGGTRATVPADVEWFEYSP